MEWIKREAVISDEDKLWASKKAIEMIKQMKSIEMNRATKVKERIEKLFNNEKLVNQVIKEIAKALENGESKQAAYDIAYDFMESTVGYKAIEIFEDAVEGI